MQKKRSGRKAITKEELKDRRWDNHPNKPFPTEGSIMNKHKFKAWKKKKRKMAQQSQRINRKK